MFHFIIYLFLFSSLLVCGSSSESQEVNFRALVSQLDRIEAKLNELNETVSVCGCKCSKRPSANKRSLIQPSDASNNNDSSAGPISVPITNQANISRFNRFNRLADNLNAIVPASQVAAPDSKNRDGQTPPMNEGDTNKINNNNNNQEITQVQDDDRQLVLRLEALFDEAFNNLNLIMREQLVGFKLTLNKLIGHLADHNYQHMILVNQLGIVKDECSLASAHLSSMSNHENGNSPPNSGTSQPSTTTCSNNFTTMRSSDASMIARLLTDSLEQIVRKALSSAVSQVPDGSKQQLSCQHQSTDQLDEQERHLRLETVLGKGLGAFQRRLDEIDSVVKQSANILNNMRQTRMGAISEPAQTTITYTNDQTDQMTTTNNNNNIINSNNQRSIVQTSSSSRWFSGSKVPNQRQGSTVVYADGGQLSSSARLRGTTTSGQIRCQTKTSLVRPTSCGQLREAGANCTGLYYVFVKGTIRHVYCDMGPAEDDGWTVVLRRIDKSLDVPSGEQEHSSTRTPLKPNWLDQIKLVQVDFIQDWQAYKSGFGTLEDWSEFFIGLELLHHLTAATTTSTAAGTIAANASSTLESGCCELQVDLQANDTSELHLRFDEFSVASEADHFRLRVGACNSTDAPELCQPIQRLNMSLFYALDQLSNCSFMGSEPEANTSSNSLPQNQHPGWWIPSSSAADQRAKCPELKNLINGRDQLIRLTDRIGRNSREPHMEPAHLYWPGWFTDDKANRRPLRKIVLKVRQRKRRSTSNSSSAAW